MNNQYAFWPTKGSGVLVKNGPQVALCKLFSVLIFKSWGCHLAFFSDCRFGFDWASPSVFMGIEMVYWGVNWCFQIKYCTANIILKEPANIEIKDVCNECNN